MTGVVKRWIGGGGFDFGNLGNGLGILCATGVVIKGDGCGVLGCSGDDEAENWGDEVAIIWRTVGFRGTYLGV